MNEALIYRYLAAEVSPDEVAQIEQWLAAAPEHRLQFETLHLIFNAMALYGGSSLASLPEPTDASPEAEKANSEYIHDDKLC